MSLSTCDLKYWDIVGAKPWSLMQCLSLWHLLSETQLAMSIWTPGKDFSKIVLRYFMILALSGRIIVLGWTFWSSPLVMAVYHLSALVWFVSQLLWCNFKPITACIVTSFLKRSLWLYRPWIWMWACSFNWIGLMCAWIALSKRLVSSKGILELLLRIHIEHD